jgi:uncharacterized protein (DUF1810 family)
VVGSTDAFDLDRFIAAQEPVFDAVLAELRAGEKRSHWMWFVFPQIAGLGSSETARRYAIGSLAEAGAYLAHPILGPRLAETTGLVIAIDGTTLEQILGRPDDLKFHSSMTLFSLLTGHPPEIDAALDKYFAGEPDGRTIALAGR